MVQGIGLKVASSTIVASGDNAIVAADSNVKRWLQGWNLNVQGSGVNAILFEYGTGSVLHNRVNGTLESVSSNQWLGNQPFEIGSGSAIHIAVDGVANASATVYYFDT